MTDESDDSEHEAGTTSTRRQVLRAAGALGLAGTLGATGWTARLLYLTADRERAALAGADAPRSRASGPSERVLPVAALLNELERYSRSRSNVGLQASVVLADGTQWCGVAGHADHDDALPLSLDHHLYVGSVTKLYTAALVMQQVQRGNLSLADSIDRWVDTVGASEITVRMLLNHTSGVPSYTGDPLFLARYFGLPTKRWRPTELLEVIRDASPDFAPGARHEYSNSNYLLLGVLLARVTGHSYEELVGRVFRRDHGLDRTYYLDYPDGAAIANAYDESIFGLGRRNLTGFRNSLQTGAYAAGGILSTAGDVAQFVRSLFTGQLLKNDPVERMLQTVPAPDDDVPAQRGYGLGVRVLLIDGATLIGHTGTIPGYSAVAMHHTDPAYTIAVLSNLSTIDQTHVCARLQTVVRECYE
jgi:D-alanyl-D-alanine carboxypeptidase